MKRVVPTTVRKRSGKAIGRARRATRQPGAELAIKARQLNRDRGQRVPGAAGQSTTMTWDFMPSGKRSGLVVSAGHNMGYSQGAPGQAFAYQMRRAMRPIRTPEARCYDVDGRLVARIVVDPVTGARRREAVNP